jgi:hypothetical protein
MMTINQDNFDTYFNEKNRVSQFMENANFEKVEFNNIFKQLILINCKGSLKIKEGSVKLESLIIKNCHFNELIVEADATKCFIDKSNKGKILLNNNIDDLSLMLQEKNIINLNLFLIPFLLLFLSLLVYLPLYGLFVSIITLFSLIISLIFVPQIYNSIKKVIQKEEKINIKKIFKDAVWLITYPLLFYSVSNYQKCFHLFDMPQVPNLAIVINCLLIIINIYMYIMSFTLVGFLQRKRKSKLDIKINSKVIKNLTIENIQKDMSKIIGLFKYKMYEKVVLNNSIIEKLLFKSFNDFSKNEILVNLLLGKNFSLNSLDNIQDIEKDDKFSFLKQIHQKSKEIGLTITLNNQDWVNLNHQVFIYFLFFFTAKLRNLIISFIFILLLGIYFFSSQNMKISDTTTQTFIIGQMQDNKLEKLKNPTYLYNEKGVEKTKIQVPTYYMPFSPELYTLAIMVPIIDFDQKKYYEPNNIGTEIMESLYKTLGAIYIGLFLLIFGKRVFNIDK